MNPSRQSVQRGMRPTLAVALVLIACGGSDVSPKTPSKTHDENELPGTLEEAESELGNAKSDIEKASECEQLCRALASMRRATAAICVLVGEDDARCALAKQTVADNAKRVAKCGCPG